MRPMDDEDRANHMIEIHLHRYMDDYGPEEYRVWDTVHGRCAPWDTWGEAVADCIRTWGPCRVEGTGLWTKVFPEHASREVTR